MRTWGDIIKLAQFATVVRDMNIKKCMIWGEEPGPAIKDLWRAAGGGPGKALTMDEFVRWWPSFLDAVQAREDEIEAEEKEIVARKAAEAAAKAERYAGDGVWYINLKEMPEAIDKAYEKGKTPLIIDNTEGFRSEVFFTYSSAHIVESKKMIVDKAKGQSVEDILEEARTKFWGSNTFKYGSTMVIRLANSACDHKNTFNSEVYPVLKLLDANEVKKVLGQENAENFKGSPFEPMCLTDDQRFECGCMGVNEKFRVVAITQFQEEDYVEFLQAMFPLELMQPIKPSAD